MQRADSNWNGTRSKLLDKRSMFLFGILSTDALNALISVVSRIGALGWCIGVRVAFVLTELFSLMFCASAAKN